MSGPSIWLVGCGNMGGAMLKGWLASGVRPADILVIDPQAKGIPAGVSVADSPPEGVAPDVLVLAVKPQMLRTISAQITVGPATTVISILAGVETGALTIHLPGADAYVRVMPNMPAAIGEGVSAVFGPTLGEGGKRRITGLLAPLGEIEWLQDEDLFHAVTGVSGSGPAYVLRVAQAMADAGVAQGLSGDMALRLALHTLAGTARLALSTGASPHALAESVRSPNGTTHAGLTILDASDLSAVMADTIGATADRSRELAAEARKA